MTRMKKRCESTLDLFIGGGTTCGKVEERLVAVERQRYSGRPLDELRNTQIALNIHPWRNAPEEQARLCAVQELRRGLEPPQDEDAPSIRRIPGTNLVAIKRRRRR
jgi:hypothetical protein